MPAAATFPTLDPRLQISFYHRLQTIRDKYLHDALRRTIQSLDNIEEVDRELAKLVPAESMKKTASFGLRGELFFPVPTLLRANAFLVGYYRLLYGFSQKEFYNKGPFGRFRCMEEAGTLPARLAPLVQPLCVSLISTGCALVDGINAACADVIHELQLLTVGPQWRGEENTRIGQKATKSFYDLIHSIARPYVISKTNRTIELRNAAGRTVLIQFGSDPDTTVSETLANGTRPIVSIEIKGGADASNVHNRLGEAEKSHQKARNLGFLEFWTILRVDVPDAVVRAESPTTSKCFPLDAILNHSTAAHRLFVQELASRLGIQLSKGRRPREGRADKSA